MGNPLTDKYWLITVAGMDYHYNPPHTTVSLAVVLPAGFTPLDWFAERPLAYSRFEFTPNALINYWEISYEQFKKLDGREPVYGREDDEHSWEDGDGCDDECED